MRDPAVRSQRTRLARGALAVALAAALAGAAFALARVDTGLGAPAGPDRLLAALDARAPAGPVTARDADAARAVLRARPIDGRAFRVLAAHADATGDTARADALYATAVRRAPRDRAARIALLDRAFARGDVAAGLDQLDALLRVAPTLAPTLLRALAPHFADPRLAVPLARHLQAAPWRGALAPLLRDPALDARDGVALLDTLAARAPLTAAEADARAGLLHRLGRDGEARAGWLAQWPALRSTSATLTDGGFEHPELTGAYAWQLAPPPGVAMRDDTVAPAEGAHALALDFSGRALASPGLQQALALAPGRYRLQAQAENGTDAQRPFAWQLACDAGGPPLLSLPLPAAPHWQAAAEEFDVPAGCTAQHLRLTYLGRSLADRQVSGTLRVDAVRIQPVRRVAP